VVLPDRPAISTYLGEKTFSMFEWWNHWPTAQVKSSGISAVAADRPSHSSLSHIEGKPIEQTSNSITKVMLDGLTNRPPAELAILSRSWSTPPAMSVDTQTFTSKGYDKTQRAFVLEKTGEADAPLRITLHATADSPLFHPAFVINGWGDAVPQLKINGKAAAWGKDMRYGLIDTLGRSNLIVWLRMQAEDRTSIEVDPIRK
jgi:hypothetical protein